MINNIMDRDMKCYKRNVYVANRTKSILNRKSWKFTEFLKYLTVLLSAKHFFVALYVMALPNMSCGY